MALIQLLLFHQHWVQDGVQHRVQRSQMAAGLFHQDLEFILSLHTISLPFSINRYKTFYPAVDYRFYVKIKH